MFRDSLSALLYVSQFAKSTLMLPQNGPATSEKLNSFGWFLIHEAIRCLQLLRVHLAKLPPSSNLGSKFMSEPLWNSPASTSNHRKLSLTQNKTSSDNPDISLMQQILIDILCVLRHAVSYSSNELRVRNDLLLNNISAIQDFLCICRLPDLIREIWFYYYFLIKYL